MNTTPQTFRYDVRTTVGLLAALSLLYLVGFIRFSAYASMHARDPEEALVKVLLCLLLFGAPAFLVVGTSIPICRDTMQRSKQSFAITPTGFCFFDGTQSHDVSWNAISDYYIERKRRIPPDTYAIRIGDTNTVFRFTFEISDYAALQKIIAERAPLGGKPWRDIDSHNNAGAPVRPWDQWNSGTRVYHQRTRANRALVYGFTVITLVVFACACFYPALYPERPDSSLVLFLAAGAMALIVAGFWWHYLTARIETDDTGLTQYSLLGRQHMDWFSVEEWYTNGQLLYLNGINKQRICAEMSFVEAELLQEEIRKRTGIAPGKRE